MKKLIILILLLITNYTRVDAMDNEKLKKQIMDCFSNQKGIFAIAFMELNSPINQILINEKEIFHAASTMKTPVMAELMNQVDKGKFSLCDSILVKNEFKSIVDGSPYSMELGRDSGEKFYNLIGKNATINDLTVDMIINSSNLATNILIEKVDAKKVTELMRKIGANEIKVLRGVEDSKAFELGLNNETTALDMLKIYEAIYFNKIASKKSCEIMIDILKKQNHNEIIPKYLPKTVEVAHKTGTIDRVVHDCAIVYPENSRNYILIYLSKHVESNEISKNIGAEISRIIYNTIMGE
ncbi:MAG TPA: class A beta-lactamase-related serine hydrolase [Melioribacteraceae bacterium]|nr:class A beta-lactamase-related serine hydrolase [Melioribacteraceae bacterium]